MANPAITILDDVRKLKAPVLAFDGGGGGGDNGGMDRIDNLEKAVARLEGDVGTLRSDVGALKSDVGALKADTTDIKIALAKLDAKFDLGEIRASVEKAHTDIYKWAATLLFSTTSIVAAIYFGIQHLPK